MVADSFRAARTRRGAATLTPAAFALVTSVAPVASGYERGRVGSHPARVPGELALSLACFSRPETTICVEGDR